MDCEREWIIQSLNGRELPPMSHSSSSPNERSKRVENASTKALRRMAIKAWNGLTSVFLVLPESSTRVAN